MRLLKVTYILLAVFMLIIIGDLLGLYNLDKYVEPHTETNVYSVKEIVEDSNGYVPSYVKEQINSIVPKEKEDEQWYDIVTVNTTVNKYNKIFNFKTTKDNSTIDIKKNTEVIVISNAQVYITIDSEGNNIYVIGNLRFMQGELTNLPINAPLSMKIIYSKDQEKDNAIKDYELVYMQ